VTQLPPPAAAPRNVSRAAAKSPARKASGRPEASEPAQLPVLVDIVSASADDRLPDTGDGPDTPVDPMPVSAANRGSGSRTRLQRMKDRGLFKNG
jgi:hypothetical protein